jgi:NAD-dependent SIR2 family protein deacetylase
MVHHGKVALCSKCGGYVKPDIIFFGQDMPPRFHTLLQQDKHKTDLVIVLGSSLKVAPVSLIPEMVPGTCKRAAINQSCVLGEGTSSRDVCIAGDCDNVIQQLAHLLDWQDELEVVHCVW